MGCCAQLGARDHVMPAETVRDGMEQLTRVEGRVDEKCHRCGHAANF